VVSPGSSWFGWPLLAASIVAACGTTASEPDLTARPPTQFESGVAANTTVDRGAPRVLLAGDSIMRELSAGLVAALEGPTHASFVATPYLAGNTAALAEWTQRVRDDAPDVVVVLIGTWEGVTVAQGFREPDFAATYAEQVRPFVELLTDAGASILWLGYPPLELAAESEQLAAFNRAWATLPTHFPGLQYLGAGDAIAPTGTFQLTVPLPDGGEALVRQTDGRHLCPDGVVLMARPVVAEVAARLGVEPVADWESAPWRADPTRFEHPELCPGDF
jgi:hypothetical protein